MEQPVDHATITSIILRASTHALHVLVDVQIALPSLIIAHHVQEQVV